MAGSTPNRLGPGRTLNVDFHDRADDDVRFRDPGIDQTYRDHLDTAGVARIGQLRVPVVCFFAMNLHYLSRAEVWDGAAVSPGGHGRFLGRATVRAIVRAQLSGALAFHRDLAEMGLRVLAPLPPRRIPQTDPRSVREVFLLMEDLVAEEVRAAGAEVVDHRGWSLDDDGALKPQYASPDDAVHGGAAFGARLLEDLLTRADRQDPSRH